MKLLLSIALTLLRAKLRQSIVAAVGVMFSITMFVTLLGFMNGLNDMLDGLILNRTPHVRLYNELKASPLQPIEHDGDSTRHDFVRSVKPKDELPRLRNATAIMEALEKDPRVLAVSPRLVAQVFFNAGTVDLNGQVNGIDVMQEIRYYKFGDYLVEGDPQDLATGNNTIVLGKGLADMMETGIGEVVQVTTATGERTMLRVAGIFQSGIADYDKVQCYANIKTVQKLLARPASYYTDINVKLHDLLLAPGMAKELSARFGVDAVDVQTANAQFETGSDVRNIISYAVGVVLLIVAGGMSGLLGGFALQHVIDNIPFVTAALPTVKTFPIDYDPKYYIIAVSFALLTTWVAGWFPARKASQVDPVEIIRGK